MDKNISKIEEYTIDKMIGRGSYGTTYIVKKDNKKYIMKKISLTKSKIADILLEVNALKQISKHNNCESTNFNTSSLCLIDDFIDYKNQEYVIIMNYLDNAITLSALLSRNKELNIKMRLDDVLFVMSRLISQLDNLHINKIVHNDIKPDNIIIQYINGQIKNVLFIDFGVSCLKLCTPSGTIVYLAPELYRIINQVPKTVIKIKEKLLNDPKTREEGKTIPINKNDYMKTDVYSLGIVFYEMLHNKMPYPYKPDYMREQTQYYESHPLEFELDLIDLRKKNPEFNIAIERMDTDHTDNKDEDETEQEKEERMFHDKINAYILEKIRENTEVLLSPEAILGYYIYYKTNPEFKSYYTENETNDPTIAKMINQIIEKMLIVNPLKRPSIHRIKGRLNKIILSLLSKRYFKSVTSSPRRLIFPIEEYID
jgi:serine/threonine protein kinase